MPVERAQRRRPTTKRAAPIALRAAAALLLCSLLNASGPATAYFVDVGLFADGSTSWNATFVAPGELQGPSLRLLTNSTVTAASAVLDGSPSSATDNVLETSTLDFASNLGAP